MNKRMAIYKEGYVNENGDITDPLFIKAFYNYGTAFDELLKYDDTHYCQEQEKCKLTGEWLTNDEPAIYKTQFETA